MNVRLSEMSELDSTASRIRVTFARQSFAGRGTPACRNASTQRIVLRRAETGQTTIVTHAAEPGHYLSRARERRGWRSRHREKAPHVAQGYRNDCGRRGALPRPDRVRPAKSHARDLATSHDSARLRPASR